MSTHSTPMAPATTTIPLPSPSITSSRRTSLDTAPRSSTVSSPALGPISTTSGPAVASTSAAQLAAARRKRAALRDFYGLKSAAAQETGGGEEQGEVEVRPSVLDDAGFDAGEYVRGLLAREGLEGILRTESGLVSDIRSLDGDRKALVYDNYSKLITATDTIRKMRMNMDPLTPTTSTLTPAISHIAGTAERLAESMKVKIQTGREGGSVQRKEEIATVKWVSSAPRRYRELLEKGDRGTAEEDWKRVRPVLDSWQKKGVEGVAEIKTACENIFK